MEVIFVCAIVFRAEHRAKALASAAMDNTQKFSFGSSSAVPVFGQCDPAAIFEYKPGHVDRLGTGMG